MGILSQALDKVSGVEERRKELDDLVARGLTSNEIRHLTACLNNIRLNKDICSNLPIEILLCVARYLNLEDLLVARSVSRKWNDIFSGEDFSVAIAKLHFPSTWERSFESVDDEGERQVKIRLKDWLPGAARDRIRRNRGIYHSRSTFSYAPRNELEWRYPWIDRQYNYGRIAFRKNRCTIIVKHLALSNAGMQSIFVERNRQALGEWVLSDQFLIATKAQPITLLAWSLSSDGSSDAEQVRLPGGICSMSAHRNQVYIVTNSNEIFVWSVGGCLKSIDTSSLASELGEWSGAVTTLFHPVKLGSFFVVYNTVHWNDGHWTLRVLIVEVEAGGVKHLHYFDSRLDYNNSLPPIVPVDIARLYDDNGLWTIVWLKSGSILHPSAAVGFNVYTKTFQRLQDADFTRTTDSKGTIQGDADYVVQFADYGYVVWSFNKIINLEEGPIDPETMQELPTRYFPHHLLSRQMEGI